MTNFLDVWIAELPKSTKLVMMALHSRQTTSLRILLVSQASMNAFLAQVIRASPLLTFRARYSQASADLFKEEAKRYRKLGEEALPPG